MERVSGSILLEWWAECMSILWWLRLKIRYRINLIVISGWRSSCSFLVASREPKANLWECVSALRHGSRVWIITDALSEHRSTSHWCRPLYVFVFRISWANSPIIIISLNVVPTHTIVRVSRVTCHSWLKLVVSGFIRRSRLKIIANLPDFIGNVVWLLIIISNF
jgi:hypothetical protein